MLQMGWPQQIFPMMSPHVRKLGHGWVLNHSSGTIESANRAIYYPLFLPSGCTVRRVWWANGSSVSASYTIAVGIYADSAYGPGAKLVSGSAAQGTASQVQFVDVTDTTLPPALYWLAIHSTNASATIMRNQPAAGSDATYRFQEATGGTLPATATPVEGTDSSFYLFGFSITASP
jgi:hypothetical protein